MICKFSKINLKQKNKLPYFLVSIFSFFWRVIVIIFMLFVLSHMFMFLSCIRWLKDFKLNSKTPSYLLIWDSYLYSNFISCLFSKLLLSIFLVGLMNSRTLSYFIKFNWKLQNVNSFEVACWLRSLLKNWALFSSYFNSLNIIINYPRLATIF